MGLIHREKIGKGDEVSLRPLRIEVTLDHLQVGDSVIVSGLYEVTKDGIRCRRFDTSKMSG